MPYFTNTEKENVFWHELRQPGATLIAFHLAVSLPQVSPSMTPSPHLSHTLPDNVKDI